MVGSRNDHCHIEILKGNDPSSQYFAFLELRLQNSSDFHLYANELGVLKFKQQGA
jgi:hypothetical protein